MTKQPDDDTTHIEQLLRTLPEFRDDLEHELQTVIDACATHAEPGEVTVKLKVEPKGGRMHVTPLVNGKAPKAPALTGVFWLSPQGRLQNRDPRQMDIETYIKGEDR